MAARQTRPPAPNRPARRGPRAPLFRLPSFSVNPRLQLGPAAWAAIGFFAIAAGGLAAIQLLGDPSAAGPRAVVSLDAGPAAAEAAPRISFSEAAAAGINLDMPDFAAEPSAARGVPPVGLDDPTPGNQRAPGDGGGELRVAVVEAAPVRPAVSPLPRAPIAGLTERGPLGLLPIIGRDGRTPARAYARPFTQGARPRVAIVVGGLGFSARATTQAIDDLPPEVTLSFVPYANNLQSWIDRARARGHEVLIELPMEPFDPEADDTGPQTLLASAEPAQNVQRLENLLSRATGYFGVTNYQGARFAATASAAAPVLQQVRRRGLVFLTNGIGPRTALATEAARIGLSLTAADRIIDARREAEAIDEQLLNLEALALQNGGAIGAGFAYPVTMQQIETWARAIGGRGYALAPVSAVMAARAAARR